MLLSLFLAVAVSAFVNTEKDQYVLEPVVTQDHISSKLVSSIAQDKYGIIWIGTDEGLYRFDGSKSEVFTHSSASQDGLNVSWINCVYPARDGRLWIGTEKGVTIFNPENGTLTGCTSDQDTKNRLSTQRIRCILEDEEGVMWIGTTNGLIKFNKETGALAFFKMPQGEEIPIANEVIDISEDINHNLWIGTFHGIYKFDKENNSFKWFITKVGDYGRWNNYIEDICYTESYPDRLFLGTPTGFTIIDTEGNIIQNLNTRNSELVDDDVVSILQLNDDELLLGTTSGLSMYHVSDNSVTKVHESESLYGKTGNRYVRRLFKDREGLVWIGTHQGLFTLNPYRKAVDIYPVRIAGIDKSAQAVITTSDGELWMATNNGILVLNDAGDLVRHYSTQDGLPHIIVKRIVQDLHGVIWAGTDDGICYLDKRSGSFVSVGTDISNLKYIYDIKLLPDGRIVTNIANGICVFKPEYQGDRIIGVSNELFDMSSHLTQENVGIPYLCVDREGIIWLATMSDGVIRFDIGDGTSRVYNETDGLASNLVYSLACDDAGDIWVGTNLGLCRLTPSTGGIVTFEDDVQLSNPIRSILPDGNDIWVALAMEVVKYDRSTGEKIICDVSNRTGGGSFIHNSICFKDNELYLGGNGFLARCRPETFVANRQSPQVVFSSMKVNDEEDIYVTSQSRVKLTHDQNSFCVWFTMPSYGSASSNSYRYRLEGFDKDWLVAVGDQNYAKYANLKPGNYVLHVSGMNADGIYSSSESTLEVSVAPPFWKSKWAYLIYAGLILLALFGLYQVLRTRYRIQQHLRAEREERLRMARLNEMKMQFFTNISHEFKTPLSIIMGTTEYLLGTVTGEEEQKQLELSWQNSERLLDLVNQILEIRKIDAGKMTPKLTNANIVSFVKELTANFSAKSARRNISLKFEPSVDELNMNFDVQKIDKVLFNLLSNAIKFTPDKGKITVNLDAPKPDSVVITVTDTGCGISPEGLPHIFDLFYQDQNGLEQSGSMKGSGLGLLIAKDYVEMHGGTLEAQSVLGEGSSFIVTLPTNLQKEGPMPEEESAAVQGEGGDKSPELARGAGSGKKIVIIEDDADMRNFLNMCISPKYEVYSAANGDIGWKMVLDIMPDLVLTDLMMEGIDGLEVCRRIKKDPMTSHIPVVILTAKKDDLTQQIGYEFGADSYLTKPFSVKTLLIRIEAILVSRQKLQDNFRQNRLDTVAADGIMTYNDRFIKELVAMVEKNLSDPDFGVREICANSKYTYQQIYRKVKSVTGESINGFIRNIRLQYAAQLLKDSDNRVNEVMYKVGFNSPSYFAKCFKKYFGVSPTELSEQRSNH